MPPASRPSPALVVSLIALFVSLGGVSYGVATGSIDSREIKNNSVRGKDIRNRTLTGKDVRNHSLTGADIDNSVLQAKRRVFDTGLAPDQSNYGRSAIVTLPNLPPGEYVVFGRVSIENDSGEGYQDVTCALGVPGPTDDAVTKRLAKAGLDLAQRTFSLQAGFSASATSSVTITCTRGTDHDPNDARDIRITAILVS